MDSFGDQHEFWYPSGEEKKESDTQRKDDKWWIPTVKVPSNGLTDIGRKWIQSQKESVNQVLKAALAINAQVLSEMQIPDTYIESLPKVCYQSPSSPVLMCNVSVDLIVLDYVEWKSEPGRYDIQEHYSGVFRS